MPLKNVVSTSAVLKLEMANYIYIYTFE